MKKTTESKNKKITAPENNEVKSKRKKAVSEKQKASEEKSIEPENSSSGTVSEDETELTAEEKKLPKQVAASKLPKILRKKYKRKKLNRLLKRIYVTKDRELVESLFVEVEGEAEMFQIPQNSLLPRKKFVRIKKIGKDVKSQRKATIKFLPLTATVAAIAAVLITIFTFKNMVVKYLLTQSMQKMFGAKTEIALVDVDVFGARITARNVAQGFRADPWKNLFELRELTIDFNLTQLLRGKFDMENIAIEGINVMTPRKTSAELPGTKYGSDGTIPEFFEQRAAIAEEAAREELQKIFDNFNPQTILNNLKNQLETPTVAKEVFKTGEQLVNKWKDKPAEIENKINEYTAKTTEIIERINSTLNIDWANLKLSDLARINEIKKIIEDSKSLGDEIAVYAKSQIDNVTADSTIIKAEAVRIKNALDHDTKFVNTEVQKIRNFKIKDGVKLISGPINTIVYKTAGKYYPYLMQALDMAMKSKSSSSGSQKDTVKESEKSEDHKRLPGVDVYYKNDNVPKFLVERLSISGPNWSGLATNISSDMDKRGAPIFAQAKVYDENAAQNHKGTVVVDARTYTKQPLVTLNYEGDNYPVSFEVPQFGLSSKSVIIGNLDIYKTGAVSIKGKLDMDEVKFKTVPFEPVFVYDIYREALECFTKMNIEVELRFNKQEIMRMEVHGGIDEDFVNKLKELLLRKINEIIKEAIAQIDAILQEQTKDADLKISEFIDLENGITAASIKTDKLKEMLEAKSKELSAKLQEKLGANMKVPGLTIPGVKTPEGSGDGKTNPLENILKGDNAFNPLGNVLKGIKK